MNPLMRLGIAGHVKLYRSTQGKKGGVVSGMPVLLLTTTGRKSGQQRTVPLVFIEHEGKRVVAASAAGAPKHPAWYLNLADKPAISVEVGAESYGATARITEGDERALLWQKITEASDIFEGYQKKTDRQIPMIVLEP